MSDPSLSGGASPVVHTKLAGHIPLAALVRLMGLNKRPPYKVTKTATYWKGKTRKERRNLLRREWSCIFSALQSEISEMGFMLPTQWSTWTELKPYEDVLDAVISALVGAYFLDDKAEPFGDRSAAIWIPKACTFGPNLRNKNCVKDAQASTR
jgi:hypothetical protein